MAYTTRSAVSLLCLLERTSSGDIAISVTPASMLDLDSRDFRDSVREYPQIESFRNQAVLWLLPRPAQNPEVESDLFRFRKRQFIHLFVIRLLANPTRFP